MTEQVYFNYNPFHLTRLMLNMYMNKELNNFGNTKILHTKSCTRHY